MKWNVSFTVYISLSLQKPLNSIVTYDDEEEDEEEEEKKSNLNFEFFVSFGEKKIFFHNTGR